MVQSDYCRLGELVWRGERIYKHKLFQTMQDSDYLLEIRTVVRQPCIYVHTVQDKMVAETPSKSMVDLFI